MTEVVQKAVADLLVEPCSAFKERAVKAVNADSDASRRMAIALIEDHLVRNPEQRSPFLVETIVALRRTAI